MLGWKEVPTQMGYGERYRKHRRWMHDAFVAKDALLSYRAMQRRETYILLAGLVSSPQDYTSHARRYSYSNARPITVMLKLSALGSLQVSLRRSSTGTGFPA